MKRVAKAGLLVSFLFALGGCPIWNGGDGTCDSDCNPTGQCSSNYDCATDSYCGADFYCHPYDPSSTGSGQTSSSTGSSMSSGTGGAPPVYCGNPKDCAAGETCGPDGTCQPGDCTDVGCIYGYVCDSSASPPACKPQNPAACGSDNECTGAGAGFKCVNGVCTAPADQCFDKTQCASGDVCADGKCVPSCAGSTCPSEYTCSAVQTCTEPAQPCTITNDCGGPTTVCVDGACVPRSPGGVCPSGYVWVENGCIPDQHASFVCSVDGVQDACKSGSLCLHHSCYISCEAPNGNACSALPSFNQCKDVTTQSGPHQVCGSSNNLGSECNPTAGQNCNAGQICIDGFCK